MSKSQIILIGGGGHCRSCIDVIEQNARFEISGIIDVRENLHQKVLGYEVIGTDDDLPDLIKKYKYFLITIGQIKNPEKRKKLFCLLQKLGAKLPAIISPLAYVSKHAQIQDGTIVMHYALVNAGAKVGKNCIINSKALVEHDVVIGDHCHIATGAIVNGGAIIYDDTFIGSNAMIKQYIKVGKQSIINGGVSVLQNVSAKSFLKK